MTKAVGTEQVVGAVARSCGALVIECADVGGHVANVSDRTDQTIAEVDRFDLVAAALGRDQSNVAAAVERARVLSGEAKTKLVQGRETIVATADTFDDKALQLENGEEVQLKFPEHMLARALTIKQLGVCAHASRLDLMMRGIFGEQSTPAEKGLALRLLAVGLRDGQCEALRYFHYGTGLSQLPTT